MHSGIWDVAMMGRDKDGKSILCIKLAPAHGKLLRMLYAGKIVPG